MNAAARALHQATIFRGQWSVLSYSKEFFATLFLIVGVLFSSCAVIYLKNTQRNLISEWQQLQQYQQQLHVQTDQLLLEKGTWVAPARLQAIAQTQLQMSVPPPRYIFVLPLE